MNCSCITLFYTENKCLQCHLWGKKKQLFNESEKLNEKFNYGTVELVQFKCLLYFFHCLFLTWWPRRQSLLLEIHHFHSLNLVFVVWNIREKALPFPSYFVEITNSHPLLSFCLAQVKNNWLTRRPSLHFSFLTTSSLQGSLCSSQLGAGCGFLNLSNTLIHNLA